MELAQLINDLNADQVSLRRRAAEALSRHPQPQAAAVSLVRACGDPDEQVREWAVSAVEGLGAPSIGDISALSELLCSDSEDASYWAATLLGRLGPASAAAVPQLTQLLVSPAAIASRQRAAWALGKIGPSAASAIDEIQQAADDDNPRLARLARQAIQQIRQG
jgi:HEAT repeat protein